MSNFIKKKTENAKYIKTQQTKPKKKTQQTEISLWLPNQTRTPFQCKCNLALCLGQNVSTNKKLQGLK